MGAAPDCPVGSTCGYPTAGYGGFGGGYGGGCGSYGVGYGGYGGYGRSLLGSVVVIPVDKIVSFTHNAI
ncbi:MAG: hypothetical protein CVV02_14645 [Firmicutes bacterium HGW-Firmicutes-7]|nr:MAG: hypothetical protein CVV02_14645 [Firmicutes bacterium HGW-Firmicutes-7]